jgi:hypothetical protein
MFLKRKKGYSRLSMKGIKKRILIEDRTTLHSVKHPRQQTPGPVNCGFVQPADMTGDFLFFGD